jgi:hypothetical protein
MVAWYSFLEAAQKLLSRIDPQSLAYVVLFCNQKRIATGFLGRPGV